MKLSVILLLASLAPAHGQTCIMVTDGSVAIYEHELAHCNGWYHEPFLPDVIPPPGLLFPYPGRLTVYFTGSDYGGQADTMLKAPVGTDYIFSDETVETICRQLWRERRLAVPAQHRGRLVGCAVK